MKIDIAPEGTVRMDTDGIIRSIATIRMFVAGHNAVTKFDQVTGEELELLDSAADELEVFLAAYRTFQDARFPA